MKNVLLTAFSLFVFSLFSAPAAFAQTPQAGPSSEAARQAELQAAWQAAGKAGTGGPHDVALIDQAMLKLPAGFFFVPEAEGARVLRALGNVVNDQTLVGLVVGTGQHDEWLVAIRYIKEGYIKDDDAKNWNADELLDNLRAGTDETNQDRRTRGFPEMEVIGWVEPPNYDAASHHLVWSLLGKHKGEADQATKGVNYNTYALGRDGYFSLNLLSDSNRIGSDKAAAHTLLAGLSYNTGKRYEDFSVGTDRIAEYGLMALVGGIAVKKLGLLALAAAFVLKFAKLLIVGAALLFGGVMKFFRRKPGRDKAGGAA